MASISTTRGKPLPLGAVRTAEGVNFAVLSRHATAVSLVLFPEAGDVPIAELKLDPRRNRTGDNWHVHVHGLPAVFCYGWRVDGPKGKKQRFDPSRVLIDPASTMVSGGSPWAATCERDPERTSRRGLFADHPEYDWGDDEPPLTEHEDSVIYELHVRGFTRHGSSAVAAPGTFQGLIEKLPYLKWLGVTAVELLPVHEFDECDCPFADPDTGAKLLNFWGYNTIAFSAPKSGYAATGDQHGQVTEFCDMVKACHANGIEVILDVVFNHTGEGDDRGRTYSLRGFDNELAYLMNDDGTYLNFSGCGNTLNCNHPLIRELILSSLRYWVGEMHVDGFRFDLASILGRDQKGNVMVEPPAIEMITEDGVLADTKLIAEPWDAAGLYQVGNFPFGRRWSEWNDSYRDDVRRFWRGDGGLAARIASRICGSADIYARTARLPRHSINFITCHDGFTLWDVVSYNTKHNKANGEESRDGSNNNASWNGGVEGETDDADVNRMREQRAKGMMATLLLSQGVPMLAAGDEFLRTQRGNNNAWCQDNELSWVDWTLEKENVGFLRFTRELIWLRRRHPVFRRRRFFLGKLGPVVPPHTPPPFPPAGPVRPGDVGLPADPAPTRTRGRKEKDAAAAPQMADIHWHGSEPFKPDFGATSRVLAFALDGRFTGREGDAEFKADNDFYFALNVTPGAVKFTVPPSPTGRKWKQLLDTTADSPADYYDEGTGPAVMAGAKLSVAAFGLVGLISEP